MRSFPRYVGLAIQDVLLKRRLVHVINFQPIQFRGDILNTPYEFRTEPLTARTTLAKMLVTYRFSGKAVCNFGIYHNDQNASMAAYLGALAITRPFGMPNPAKPVIPLIRT